MFDWLSGFLLNPALVLGVGAVSSPILIHILSRRRFRRVRWAAMTFLLEAHRRNRRRVRLEQLILLFLRCLAVLLIAVMMARPFVRGGLLGLLAGAEARTDRIFLLDDSYSMAYRPPSGVDAGEAVFDRAKRALEQMARSIAATSPGNPVTLLRTSDPRRPVFTAPHLGSHHLDQLRGWLDAATASQTTARMANAFAVIAAMVGDVPAQTNVTVYIASDFQGVDWTVSAEAAGASGPVGPLVRLVEDGASVNLVLLDVGVGSPGNVAVTEVRADQSQIVAGVAARFEVGVSNHTTGPVRQVELMVSLAGHTLPPIVIPRIGPRQTVREPVEITFPNEGSEVLRVELLGGVAAGDGLALDNTRWCPVDVVPAVRLLIVDGEVSDDPYLDEVYLLKTALRPMGRASSGNELMVVRVEDLEALELGEYDAVILANVYRLGTGGLRRLESYVREGGGLIVFLGDQVDVEYYRAHLYAGGRGLLPRPVGDVVRPPAGAGPFALGDWDVDHPVMRAFVGELASVLRVVQVSAFSDSALAVEGAAASPDGEDVAVFARFDDAAHSPAILERRYGRGLCVLVTTSCDQEWNDWAGSFSYVPLMLELVQYAARRSGAGLTAVVGMPLVCSVESGLSAHSARIETPDYPVEPAYFVEIETGDDGACLLPIRATWKTGVYRIELTGAGGEAVVRYAAVNADAAESNLAGAGRVKLEDALIGVPFEYVRDLSVFEDEASSGRHELWWPLLLAAITVLMFEQVMAWWFGRRG